MIVAVVSQSATILSLLEAEAEKQATTVVVKPSVQDALLVRPAAIFTEWLIHESAGPLLDSVRAAADYDPPIPVVVLVPRGDPSLARKALQAGATDVLFLPLDEGEVSAELAELSGNDRLLSAAKRLLFEQLRQRELIGTSQVFKQCLLELQRASASDANVLLLGATGTGKEMFARAIHQLSRRDSQPFIAVNCAGFPAGLLESELFGHVRGAFTGADRAREGRFAAVRAGTLLLDEIGDLELSLQSKLLRVLDTHLFERLGENETSTFNGRLIAATSVNLHEAVSQGRFRPDLLGRLNQFQILLPPLQKRQEDISLLARHFVEKHAHGLPFEISGTAMELLRGAEYPMNIRQLENAVVNAIARCQPSLVILPRHLPLELLQVQKEQTPREENFLCREENSLHIKLPKSATYQEVRETAIEAMDKFLLNEILAQHGGNQSAAADAAGIDRKTFTARLKSKRS